MGVDRVKRIFAQVPGLVASLLDAQEDIEYSTPSVDPEEIEYSSDEWDGSEAVASYPSAEDADLSPNYALVPSSDENRDAKSNFKLPFRNSHEGRANENAVIAAIAAINGSRGGVEGVSESALRDAYGLLVEMAVEAGIYEEAEDAPDFSPPASNLEGQAHELEAARLSEADLDAETGDGLTGVVWAAGEWKAHINGEPTKIEVPEDTITETYEALQSAVEEGNPPKIGLDHYDTFANLQVAEEIGFLDVAEAQGFAMSEDENEIILTESRFTSDDAREAYENGDFDGMGFSLHGGVEVLDDEGDAVTIRAGSDIERIDVVEQGAVSHAKVSDVPQGVAAIAAKVADMGDMPEALEIVAAATEEDDGKTSGMEAQDGSALAGLMDASIKQKAQTEGKSYADIIDGMASAAGVSTATVYRTLSGAISCPSESRLRAYANEIGVDPGDLKDAAAMSASCEYADTTTQAKRGNNMDIDDFDNPEAALEAASGKLEEKNERIEELEASKSELEDKLETLEAAEEKAEAYEKIAAAQGLDEDAEADAVVDAFTEELREEIAELEASLPAEDTGEDSIEERVEELAGTDPAELRAKRGDLANKVLRTKEARANYDKAVAASEMSEGEGSGYDEETDAIAESALTATDALKQAESEKSPSEWVEDEYGIDASEYSDETELRDAVIEAQRPEGN